MKNKKGFTIVELLAVIVLLAAVMILIYPNVLEKVREQEKQIDTKTEQLLYQSTYNFLYKRKGMYPLLTGKQYCVKISTLSYEDELIIDNYKNLLNSGYVQVEIGASGDTNQDKNAYRILLDSTGCQGDIIMNAIIYADGTEVYFNPDTGKACSVSDITNTTSGCMKWYTFGDTGENASVKMILGHNTTDSVAFNSTGGTTMNEIKTRLNEDTASWNEDVKSTVSLISIDELSMIVGKSMSLESWNYFNDTSFSWLYQKNTDKQTVDGYWTSTVGDDLIWVVSFDGYTTKADSFEDTAYGIRPVITVSKSQLQ